jgi:diaminopimelate epimerase
MNLSFTKMHGLGNDFVVVDAVRQSVTLNTEQLRWIADRRVGIGADQILLVQASSHPKADFDYRIFNADGQEVQHCGNGARCFVRFVNDQQLSAKSELVVNTASGLLTLTRIDQIQVRVDMLVPECTPESVCFDRSQLQSIAVGVDQHWQLPIQGYGTIDLALISMGNPHAVQWVQDCANAPVAQVGPLISKHSRFGQGVNAGFMQIIDRHTVRLRVYERGAGETMACGTGACAAVVAGIRAGQLDQTVKVIANGGELTVEWPAANNATAHVFMTGPTANVFEGKIAVPAKPNLLSSF